MRCLILFVLISACLFSIAQENHQISIENPYRLAKTFGNGLEMYVNNCSDTIFNKVITRTIIEKADSLKSYIENLAKGETSLICAAVTDSNMLDKICEILLGRENLANKICFVNGVLYHEQDSLYSLFVFSKSGFNRYIKKKSKEQDHVEHLTGKVTIKHKVNFYTYAHSYILIKKEENWRLYNL